MADEKLDTQIRQEQIVEAALGLVAAYGVKRLSVAAVARRVGLVPSGIYRHFKSKDDILAAVLDLLEKRLLANVEAARQESFDPLERLHSLLIRHIRFIRDGRAIPHIVFSGELHSGHPERRARVQQIIVAVFGPDSPVDRRRSTARPHPRRLGHRNGCVAVPGNGRARRHPLAPERRGIRRHPARSPSLADVPHGPGAAAR